MGDNKFPVQKFFYKVFAVTFLIFTFTISAQINEAYKGKYDEPFRPQFHFTPQQKWMNDPNGLVYLNGKYHLFYQYYPNDIVWGPMHWGHAESIDLLHWKHLPIALYPDTLGYIFSGSAVIDKDNTAGFGKNAMIAIFTYHNEEIWKAGRKNTESQGIEYSLDEGKTWVKYKGNPVLNNSGEQDFRDPKVFRYNNKCWIMVLAAGDRTKFFSSMDLEEWKFESDFKPEENLPLGVWECPDFFKIKVENESKEKWVLISNNGGYGPQGGSGIRYFVGDFDGKSFTNFQPAKWLDFGTDNYAAVTYNNVPGNRRILLGWMTNQKYSSRTPTKVWRSAMTLPRELKLIKENADYFLIQKPVDELKGITEPLFNAKKESLPFIRQNMDLMCSDISFDLPDGNNDITVEFKNSAGESYKFEIKGDTFSADRSKSGKIDFSNKFADNVQKIQLGKDIIKTVKVILDKSSVEIFLNGGKYTFTNLIFPNLPYSELSISSGIVKKITNFKISRIKSMWN